MAGLCIADIDRWSVGEISAVFGICMNVADHCDATSRSLANLDAFSTWTGDAAEAAKDSVHTTRKDLDRNGEVAKKVAEAARKAEQDIVAVRKRLTDLRTEAADNGLTIDAHTDTVRPVAPPNMQGWPAEDKAAYYREIEDLQFRVNALLMVAVDADRQLADAIKLTEGEKEDFSAVPTPKDVVLGGVAGGTAAKTDLIREVWSKALKDNPTKLDTGVLKWLENVSDKPLLRGFSRVGSVAGVATAVPSVLADIGDGNSPTEAVTREGVGLATGMAVGAEVGAGVGNIVPVAGTAVGAVVGAGVGAIVAWGTSKGIEKLWSSW